MAWKRRAKRGAPKRKAAARRPRRAVGRMPKMTTGNFASATEQFSIAATAGVTYDFTFDMTDVIRTQALMSIYQYYRVTSVELRFKPQSDTFAAGGGAQLPYLFFQYDKSGALGGLNAAQFEEIGTKAIRLDDKTLIRKWKPSVLLGDYNAAPGTAVGQFKVSPWMPTHLAAGLNDSVAHHGAVFLITKQNPSDATIYDVDVVINVQYRKPLIAAQGARVNPPRITQGNTTAVDLSLNPHLLT